MIYFYDWEKLMNSKLWSFKLKKFFSSSVFGLAPTHTDTISNFFLQLEYQRYGSKTVCGFSTILVLKWIMNFLKSKSPCFLLKKNINFKKIQDGIENGKSHSHF